MCPGSLTARNLPRHPWAIQDHRPEPSYRQPLMPSPAGTPVSLLTCTNCGQKSPLQAAKCKHCGRAFGRPPQRRGGASSSGRVLVAVLVLAGAGLISGVYWWWPSLRLLPSAATPEMSAGLAPPSSEVPVVPESRATPVDTVRVRPAPAAKPAKDSAPPAAPAPKPVKDSAQPVAPAAAPAAASIDPAHQRYAQDWVKLRSEPSTTAPVLRVLQPGEVVTIDSLLDGWYRVVSDQQATGYVDRQYLDTLPPGQH